LLREAAAAYTQPGKPPGCLIIDAAVNCTCPDVAQMLAGLRNDSVNQLENVIGRAIARGELAADADAHTLATYTSVVMQGMAAQARDGTTPDQLQAAAAQAMQAWPWNNTATE
jgi:AcrR family transcriptional regulator